MIIDELRPKMLTYSDLLRITDPHRIENQVMAPCRYNDKALAFDLIIITTPLTPSEFYHKQFGVNTWVNDCPDGIDQLLRRITVTLEMSGKKIQASEYSIRGSMYIPIPGTDRPNPYSGLVYCADCSAKLHYCTTVSFENRQNHFRCSNYKSNTGTCSAHFIREMVLHDIVLEDLRETIAYVRDYERDFIQDVMAKNMTEQKRDLNQKRRELTQAEKRIAELDMLFPKGLCGYRFRETL